MPPVQQVRKRIVVEVKPVGNWQEACRRALRQMNEYAGEDNVSLRVAGQALRMDFDGRARSCPALHEALRMIPGISRVFAESG